MRLPEFGKANVRPRLSLLGKPRRAEIDMDIDVTDHGKELPDKKLLHKVSNATVLGIFVGSPPGG